MRKISSKKPRDPWYKKADEIFLTALVVVMMFIGAVTFLCADMAEHPELSGSNNVEEILQDVMSA